MIRRPGRPPWVMVTTRLRTLTARPRGDLAGTCRWRRRAGRCADPHRPGVSRRLPVASGRLARLPHAALQRRRKTPPIDVVLISRDHYDHLDTRHRCRIIRLQPDVVFVCPLGVGAPAVVGIGADRIRMAVGLDVVVPTASGHLKFVAVPARHFSGRGLDRSSVTVMGGLGGDRSAPGVLPATPGSAVSFDDVGLVRSVPRR